MVLFKSLFENIGILEIWLIGNLTKDRKIFHSTIIEANGGPITFSLPWLLIWAPDAVFHIFCSGPKSSISHLPNKPNIHIHLQEDQHISFFELDYQYDQRRLRLLELPDPIMPELINDSGLHSIPDIIIFCPVFNEVKESLILTLRQKYPTTVIVLDVQGFTRQIAADKTILLNSWIPSSTFLSSLDIIKISNDEITSNKIWKVLASNHNTHIILTAGEHGSLLYSTPEIKNRYGFCPPSPMKENPSDPTGAGDVFLAFVALGNYLTKDIIFAMTFSTIITKFHLSGMKTYNLGQSGYENLHEFITLAQNDFDKISQWKWVTKTHLDENPWEKIK